MFRALTLAALVAYASAHLSSQCTSALEGVIANPDAADCLSASSLIYVLADSSSSSSSPSLFISAIDNWLNNLCAVPACSNATLAALTQNVTTGCRSDLGLSSNLNTSTVIGLVEKYYPTVRQVVCLRDGNTNCITETLTNIQNTVASVLNVTAFIPFMTGANNISALPTNISCTNCIKAIYNDINQTLPSSIAADATASLQSHCGASFIDGRTPSGIVDSATTTSSAPSPSNFSAALGGVSLLSHGVFTALSLSGLVLISTLFTLLA